MMPMPAQTSATTTVSTPLHITPARGRQGFPGTEKNKKSVAFGWLGLHTANVTARQGKTRQIFRGGCGAQRDRIRPPVSCRHHRRYSLTRYLLLSFCHSDTNRPASSSARACSCSCSCSRSCASQSVLTVGQSQHGQSGRGHHAFMLSS